MAIIEVSANPGDSTEDVIRLTNNSDDAVIIETIPKNFTPQGEEGAVTLTEEETSFSLADWITLIPDSAVISPRSTQDFTLQINVPDNAEPGGHFGAVVFKTVPPPATGASAAQVSQEIAPVILAKVAGDIVEGAELVEFKSSKSFWSNEKPITFETRVNNTGNVHFKPTGNIVIKNMFGSEVANIPIEGQNIIPSYPRKLLTEWSDPGFAVGRYTADLTLVFGEDDQIITASTSFTVFPYQTLVPAIILIGLLLYVLIRFRSRVWMALKVLSGRN